MAPALPEAARDTDAVRATDKRSQSQRRRALTSVDNVGLHMEEEDMGLQSAANLSKDTQEMDQILVDLGSSDLAQADLLQAIKTLESSGDVLSTGDTDAIFPLSGFDLAETVEPESDGAEDKIRVTQTRLERRTAFLHRRLRILQARAIGKRVSEEAAQTFEKCSRGARRDSSGRPVGLKAFLKRIETTAALQANAASKPTVGPTYFNAEKPSTSSAGDTSRTASIGVPSGTLAGLEDTAGALRSHLSVVKHELDSDATATSSGAESNDEAVTYNNQHQKHMPIEERALWRWQRTRASVASRWCWLQVQMQELEYKIRQHTDLHQQVRAAKGAVEFEGEPSAYEGALPGGGDTCARVRPLRRETFKKRKLLQMHNLHVATAKAAKPADIRCGCCPTETCAVCTGRAVATQGGPPLAALPPARRLALLDPGYHPVLSDLADVSPSMHLSALTSRSWFRSRSRRSTRGAHHAAAPPPPPPPAQHAPPHTAHLARRPHPTRMKRGRPPLSRKNREIDPETPPQERAARGRWSTESRGARVAAYDIDNIVIPQSVAASTRPQILHYKEIITPKWRINDIWERMQNNGALKPHRIVHDDGLTGDNEVEPVWAATVYESHARAVAKERSRYLRKKRARRSHASPPSTPPTPPAPAAAATSPPALPPSPQPPPPPPPAARAFSPRRFPLSKEEYATMLADMPPRRPPSSPRSRSRSRTPSLRSDSPPPLHYGDGEGDGDGDDEDGEGEDEDPRDREWDPAKERSKRHHHIYK